MALLKLSVVVNGFANLMQPVLMSLGAVFTVVNIGSDLMQEIQYITWRNDADEDGNENKKEAKNLDAMIDEMLKVRAAKN